MALKFFIITFHHYLSAFEIEGFLRLQGLVPVSSLDPERPSDLYVGTYIGVSTQVKRYAVEVPAANEKRFLEALQTAQLVATICDGGIVHSLSGKKKPFVSNNKKSNAPQKKK